MFIKWECPACKHQNVLNIDLESKEGMIEACRQMNCRQASAINWTVSVTATAALTVQKGKELKLVGQA